MSESMEDKKQEELFSDAELEGFLVQSSRRSMLFDQEKWRLNIRSSYFELFFCYFIFIIWTFKNAPYDVLSGSASPTMMIRGYIAGVSESYSGLVILFIVFFQTFTFLLLKRTALVLLYNELFSKRSKIMFEHIGSTKPSVGDPRQVVPLSQIDYVEQVFRESLQRSSKTSEKVGGRPNTLLFVGTVVAVGGLLFFYATMPDLNIAEQFKSGDLASAGSKIIEMLPRLLMLAFIQLLAGFFLRQYSSSVEDYRFYEGMQRERENFFAVYQIIKKYQSNPDYSPMVLELLKSKDMSLLDPDKKSRMANVAALEQNEFKGLVGNLTDLAQVINIMKASGKTDDAAK